MLRSSIDIPHNITPTLHTTHHKPTPTRRLEGSEAEAKGNKEAGVVAGGTWPLVKANASCVHCVRPLLGNYL
jgi:hypothetical protein